MLLWSRVTKIPSTLMITLISRQKHSRLQMLQSETCLPYERLLKLYKEVANGNCPRQLSIGGKLNLKNRDSVTVEMTPSGLSRTINDLELDHIASTREKHAANPRTSFLEAISKALDDAEQAGWSGLTKSDNSPDDEDVRVGMGVLASLGNTVRKMFGGRDMHKEDQPMTPPASTPPEETTTPKETPAGAPTTTALSLKSIPLLRKISATARRISPATSCPGHPSGRQPLRPNTTGIMTLQKTRKSGDQIFTELHISLDGSLSVQEAHDFTEHLEDDIAKELPNVSVTIHIEPEKNSEA